MSLTHLIKDHWHFAAHQADLKHEGDFIKFNLLGEDVVVYNDGQQVIAFDNVCPHRGARFFDERHGRARAVCKYHGWTISQGRLIIPQPESYSPCPKRFGQYSVEAVGGFLFFAMAPKTSLLEQLGESLYNLLEAISFDAAHLVDVNDYSYECHAFVAVENALEPDHVPFVHRDTLLNLELTHYRNEFYGKNSIVRFDVGSQRVRKGLDKFKKYFSLGHHAFDGYMSIHLYPFSFISSTGGYSYSVQSFFPVSDDETDFVSRLYFPDLTDARHESVAAVIRASVTDLNRKVFLEDHAICRRIRYSAWKSLIDGPLSQDEVKIKRFRENLKLDVREF
ncbi:Rieske 2Fe-2S domain-containing protein [Curvibacter sp. RS43]|uniref:aromatic ring-hydroxylating oxygenase subunit alpha n=1 Tax=Curvibacter microcysteis TaxID=3026419 RepID=UPI00235EFE99|nr:Rieske 2Fe-2S domain-containing protein [Curvibacter sp. RS43]MDD0811811.1 Rieske 2Fe-2S domain-containing protein [Curvibacter sp. RS43]